MTASIVVLDCQRMFSEGLRAYFENNARDILVQDIICTSKELSDTIKEEEFDVLVLELNISDQDGLLIIEEMKEHHPAMRIIVLSAHTESKLVRSAMLKGADAFVSKSSTFEELIFAIKEVMLGHTFIGDGLRTSPASTSRKKEEKINKLEYNNSYSLKQKLTKREYEILELIAQGKNNKIIGSELYISDQTVGVHRKNIMKKLGIRNAVSLVKFAFENHLV